jgi:hypothetical protein
MTSDAIYCARCGVTIGSEVLLQGASKDGDCTLTLQHVSELLRSNAGGHTCMFSAEMLKYMADVIDEHLAADASPKFLIDEEALDLNPLGPVLKYRGGFGYDYDLLPPPKEAPHSSAAMARLHKALAEGRSHAEEVMGLKAIEKRCECGAAACRSNLHSSWCPAK